MSWDEYISDGISAVKNSDHAGAEQAFKQALKFAKHNFARHDSRLALPLSLIGHMYFHNQDFQRAEMLLEQSLRLHSESDTLNETCVLMDLFSLGEIKVARGKRVEACRLYQQTLERLQAAAEYDEAEVLRQGTQQFEELFQKNLALLSYTERLELMQPELIHSILAAANASELEPEEEEPPSPDEPAASAEQISEDDTEYGDTPPVSSITMSEDELSTTGSRSIREVWKNQLHTGLSALLSADDEQESYVTAYLNIESALRLAQQMFAPGDKRLTSTIKALADASAKLRMFELAESLYREAIALAKRSLDGDELAVAALRLSLALFYAEFDQLRQAKKMLDEVKVPPNLSESEYGKGLLPRIEKVCVQIGIYNSVQGLLRQAQSAEESQDREKAAKLANNALSTLRQGFTPDHPEHARVLRYRSRILLELGQTKQSEELSQRADRIEHAYEASRNQWDKVTEELPRPDLQRVAV
jgi:hypothetical protein